MAYETAVDNLDAVSLCMQGNGLAKTGRVVLDSKVLQRDVVAFYLQRIGAEGAHLIDVGMVIVGDDGLRGILATEFDVL